MVDCVVYVGVLQVQRNLRDNHRIRGLCAEDSLQWRPRLQGRTRRKVSTGEGREGSMVQKMMPLQVYARVWNGKRSQRRRSTEGSDQKAQSRPTHRREESPRPSHLASSCYSYLSLVVWESGAVQSIRASFVFLLPNESVTPCLSFCLFP